MFTHTFVTRIWWACGTLLNCNPGERSSIGSLSCVVAFCLYTQRHRPIAPFHHSMLSEVLGLAIVRLQQYQLQASRMRIRTQLHVAPMLAW